MTEFTIPRGQARALWVSLLPHAGKQSGDTPDFGRIRFAPRATHLVAWTTDGVTSATAYVDVIDHHDDGADTFDLATSAVKAALAVFQGPKDTDARQMWDDRPLLVLLTSEAVVLTEVGDIVEGRSVQLERILTAGEDRYPDVPRVLRPAPLHDSPVALVSAEALAKFIPSAKAWGGTLLLAVTGDRARVEVSVGTRFYGLCPARPERDTTGREVPGPELQADTATPWAERLAPLVTVKTRHVDVVDLAMALTATGLTVAAVRPQDGDPQ